MQTHKIDEKLHPHGTDVVHKTSSLRRTHYPILCPVNINIKSLNTVTVIEFPRFENAPGTPTLAETVLG